MPIPIPKPKKKLRTIRERGHVKPEPPYRNREKTRNWRLIDDGFMDAQIADQRNPIHQFRNKVRKRAAIKDYYDRMAETEDRLKLLEELRTAADEDPDNWEFYEDGIEIGEAMGRKHKHKTKHKSRRHRHKSRRLGHKHSRRKHSRRKHSRRKTHRHKSKTRRR